MSSFDRYDAELVRLRQLVARKREHFPELSSDECAHLAVEELFDPQNENNPEFRALLLAQLADVRRADRGRESGNENPPRG